MGFWALKAGLTILLQDSFLPAQPHFAYYERVVSWVLSGLRHSGRKGETLAGPDARGLLALRQRLRIR